MATYVKLEDGKKTYTFVSETSIKSSDTDIFAPTSANLGRCKVVLTGTDGYYHTTGQYYLGVRPISSTTGASGFKLGTSASNSISDSFRPMEYGSSVDIDGVTYYGYISAKYGIWFDTSSSIGLEIAVSAARVKVIKYNSATSAIEVETYNFEDTTLSITASTQSTSCIWFSIPKKNNDIILAIGFEYDEETATE